jgi:hypothetical protein
LIYSIRVSQFAATYREAHTFKPASSRSESKEVFLIGRGQLRPFSVAEFSDAEEAEAEKRDRKRQ